MWIGNSSLKDQFPDLYKIARNKRGFLVNFISTRCIRSWKVPFIRARSPEEALIVAQMMSILDAPPPLDDRPDRRLWRPSPDRKFSVKSLYLELTNLDPQPLNFKRIWHKSFPPKVSFLLLTFALNKAQTDDNRQRRKYHLASRCSLCLQDIESINHITLHCSFVRDIWLSFLPATGLTWIAPSNPHSLFESWYCPRLSAIGKTIWPLIPAAIIWIIWLERNSRIFDGVGSSFTSVSHQIRSLLFLWYAALDNAPCIRFVDLICNWDSIILKPP